MVHRSEDKTVLLLFASFISRQCPPVSLGDLAPQIGWFENLNIRSPSENEANEAAATRNMHFDSSGFRSCGGSWRSLNDPL